MTAADEVLGEVPPGLTEASSIVEDLGADSLDLLEIVMALEDELDLTADERDFVGVETVGDAVDVLTRLVA
jgi:acyl carrier protein